MDGDPAQLRLDALALARVHSGPDLDAELGRARVNRLCAPDRARGAVEGRHEPVAGGVDLVSTESQELAPHGRVMILQEVAPAAVAERRRLLGRADDVGEENGRQHTISFRGAAGAGQALLDLVRERIAVAEEDD